MAFLLQKTSELLCCIRLRYKDPEGSAFDKVNLRVNAAPCAKTIYCTFFFFFARIELTRCPDLWKRELLRLELVKPPFLTGWMCTQHRIKDTLKIAVERAVLKWHWTHAYSLLFPTRLLVGCSHGNCLHSLCHQKACVLLKSSLFCKKIAPACYCVNTCEGRHMGYLTVTWKLDTCVYFNILRPQIGSSSLEPARGQKIPTEHARLCVVTISCGRPLVMTMGRLFFFGCDCRLASLFVGLSGFFEKVCNL